MGKGIHFSLLLTFVEDLSDRNMAILVECHNFHLSCLTEPGSPPNVLRYFHRRWMELSTDM